MGIYKRAAVSGMVHELTRQGYVSWPSKLAEEIAADEIADSLSDEEMPEVTGDDGLTEAEAENVLNKIVEVASEIEAKTGGYRDEEVNKVASSNTYEDVASYNALRLMEKAAEEATSVTGPDVPGPSAPTVDNSATAEGVIDQKKNPSAAVVVPQGTTGLDTKPGAVGKEEDRDQPGAQASEPTGDVAKLANMLAALGKSAAEMDGASLSGGSTQGPAPTPRQDLSDNLKIPGAVASGQGQTAQKIPNSAHVGELKNQPAGNPGPTAPTPTDPAQDAVKKASEALLATPEGRNLLGKLAQVYQQSEAQQKEAQASQLLQQLANLS